MGAFSGAQGTPQDMDSSCAPYPTRQLYFRWGSFHPQSPRYFALRLSLHPAPVGLCVSPPQPSSSASTSISPKYCSFNFRGEGREPGLAAGHAVPLGDSSIWAVKALSGSWQRPDDRKPCDLLRAVSAVSPRVWGTGGGRRSH